MIPHSRRFRLFALVVIGVALTAGGPAARVARAQSALQVLHTFAGDPDGASPGALIQGVDGNFYGTTRMGGDSSNGTAFQMTPDGTVSILHSFADGPDDGKEPEGALIQASDGDFYGTTAKGGTFGKGTVYRMTADGSVTLLYSFAGEPDGSTPLGGLLEATDGNLYGTTYWGGAFSNGTAFRIAPNGSGYAVLHDFARGVDGAWPVASLVQATDGNFYGTTALGGGGAGCGSAGCGTAFRMTVDGVVTILHAFSMETDGAGPSGALIEAAPGTFYGTTGSGPSGVGNGTIFQLTVDGLFATVQIFNGPTDGAFPYTPLIQGTDGNFYGTTVGDGSHGCGIGNGCGTIFGMLADGSSHSVLYTFTGMADGYTPEASPIQATDGNFYGTTSAGGAGMGVVFRFSLNPSGTWHAARWRHS